MNDTPTSHGALGPEWMPVADAAVALGQTDRHVRRRCVDGSLPALQDAAGRWFVARSAVPVPADTRPDMSGDSAASGDAVVRDGGVADGGAAFDELELFALRSELAQLRLQVQAITAERDEARRAEHRAVLFAEAHRRAFEALSEATSAAMQPSLEQQ